MRFQDFKSKIATLSDWLVGYDGSSGEYVRVKLQDLKALIGSGTAQTISVQYSTNGSVWHDVWQNGDCYMRIKAGAGAWSGAIRISVSAYDIWKEQQGGTGTVSQFLNSLKGEPGYTPRGSDLRIDSMSDYYEFRQLMVNALENNKNVIKTQVKSEVVGELEGMVKAQFEDMNMEEGMPTITTLSEDDTIVVMTSNGLRRMNVKSLVSNVEVKTASYNSYDKAKIDNRSVITLVGEQTGKNAYFTTGGVQYVSGTTDLYRNGNRLTINVDYIEDTNCTAIRFLTNYPVATDVVVFMAVRK